MLYIVPTPIGNLGDITARALDALKACAFIFCEDTRQTSKLVTEYGLSAKLVRYNESDESSLARCAALLAGGKTCALVSDAGTPAISDPGYKLVRTARANGVKITVLPGPAAVTTALSGAGLGGGGFTFLGFTPRKKGKIVKLLSAAFAVGNPVALYESPYRVVKFLEIVQEAFGPAVQVVLARELTKTFEEWVSGPVGDVIANLRARKKILGEFVVILDARQADAAQTPPLQEDDDESEDF